MTSHPIRDQVIANVITLALVGAIVTALGYYLATKASSASPLGWIYRIFKGGA